MGNTDGQGEAHESSINSMYRLPASRENTRAAKPNSRRRWAEYFGCESSVIGICPIIFIIPAVARVAQKSMWKTATGGAAE